MPALQQFHIETPDQSQPPCKTNLLNIYEVLLNVEQGHGLPALQFHHMVPRE